MSLDRFRRFANISKVDELEDGTVRVFGIASSEDVDSDGEIILADAMKAATAGYLKWGAIREMHQANKAAGTALEAEVRDDGKTYIGVHVVDPDAVAKVKTRVYKGFSIGGKVLSRDAANKKIITGIDWIETSLVDRPANPSAEILVVKAEAPITAPDEVPVDPKTETPTVDNVEKSIWTLRNFADLLQQLCWLANDAAADAFWNGNGSGVPASIKAWVADGAKLLQGMAEDEVKAMLAAMGAADPIKAAAAKAAAIAEAAEKVSGLEAQIAEATAALETAKSEHATALAAAQATAGEELAKVAGSTADLEKRAKTAEDSLAKLQGEHTEALAKVQALEAERVEITKGLQEAVEDLKKRGVIRAVPRGAEAVDEPTGGVPAIDPKDPQAAVKMIRSMHQVGAAARAIAPTS